MTTDTRERWYVAKSASQGLIVDEDTGENIAVSYDKKNAAKLAAAPELIEALQNLIGMCNLPEVKQAMMKHEQAYYHATMRAANEAVYKAAED